MKKMYYTLFTLCLVLVCSFSMSAQNQQPFRVGLTSAATGSEETICLDVQVYGEYDVLSMQYSMHYDSTILHYQSIEQFNLPDLTLTSFGIPGENSPIPEGTINFSWLNSNNELVPTTDGQVLYRVCFDIVGEEGDFTEVIFGDNPTPFEVITTNDESLAVNYTGGQVLVGASTEALSITAADVTTIDCQDTNLGAIDITLAGGVEPFEFIWTDGADQVFVTEDLTSIPAGTYSLTVTDAESTTISALFHLNLTEVSYILSSSITDATCDNANGSIHLSPVNDFSIIFNWSTGEISELISNLEAGDYQVTITDTENGCSQVETFTVGQGNLSIASNYECSLPSDATLRIVAWGDGVPPYTATLDNGASQTLDETEPVFEFPVEIGATYLATVTDANGCTNTISTEISCQDTEEMVIGTSYECINPDNANLSVFVWSGGVAPYSISIDGNVTFKTAEDIGVPVEFSLPTFIDNIQITVFDASGNQITTSVALDCEDDNTPTGGSLFISSPQITVGPGEAFCIPVLVDSFININSLQFAMSWNKDVIEYSGVDNLSSTLGLTESNFGMTNEPLDDGILRFSWFDDELDGETLANGSTLFEVCFVAIAQEGGSIFNFTDSVLPIEASNANQETVQVFRSNGIVSINEGSGGGNEITFTASDEVTFPDGNTCIDISVEDFIDVLAMQFSMQWNPDVISYSSLQFPNNVLNDLSEASFGTGSTNEGQLAVSWFDPTAIDGVSLDDGTVLFQVCFQANGDEGESSTFEFTNSPTPIEVLDNNDDILTFIGQAGSVTIDMDGFVVPGDTDRNLEADHYDLLNIGLGFGQTGTSRPNANLEFTPQASEDWGITTPLSGIDYKHADTDGNGEINAADIDGITMNWGETINLMNHENTDDFNASNNARMLMSPFFVLPDTINAGEAASFPIILGTQGFPATGIYGLAFSLIYDTEVIVPESVFADFQESWLGHLGDDLISVQKDFSNIGQIDIAITRTDGQSMNGVGKLGSINVIIEEVIFRSDEEYEMKFDIINVRAISPTETPLVFEPRETTSIINTEVSGTNNPQLEQLLSIVPNPVQNYFNIQATDINIQQVDVYHVNGQLIRSHEAKSKISTSDLISGTYLVKIITDEGVLTKRIVVQK